MKQTWQNGKSLILGLILTHFGPNLVTKVFSLWALPLLDVIYCCSLTLYAISRKTNEPDLRKWQKIKFLARFWPLWPKFGLSFFFESSGSVSQLNVMVSYHYVQHQNKTSDPILRKLSDERTEGQTDES